ncbi:MAG TPA: lytic transglycosylase domain-containing protein [Polyangia bacterium]
MINTRVPKPAVRRRPPVVEFTRKAGSDTVGKTRRPVRVRKVAQAAVRASRSRRWFRPGRWLLHMHRKTGWRIKAVMAALVLLSPIWLLNAAVAYFGNSIVFPLSPYFLREKAAALMTYFAHRPGCLFTGHPETAAVVARIENRHRLPRGLLAALVHVESNGRPHRISYAGAMGPGQLMPGTARELGVADPFDTADNLDGAARLLRSHLTRFGSTRLAVAAYNAGPGAVRGRVPNNGQTPAYVDRVMRAYRGR